MKSESLKDKTVKGVGWSSIDSIANYGIGFVVGLILARLLSPNEYGLIGILTIFINVFNTIIDSGFSTALIRRNDIKDIDYSTVFIINLVVSTALALLMFLGAPYISVFFERPELTPITQVMSLILVINAVGIVQKTILTKNIDFKTQTKISIISHASSGVIGIALALTGCGVWALVAQQLSARLFTTTLLWIYNKWKPRLEFSIESFKSLFGFSWKLLVAQIFNTAWKELYKFVVGKFYHPETLGLYTRAEQFNMMFSSNITTVVKRVSLPTLSAIKDERERLVDAYRRIIRSTMLVTSVCMFMLAAIAKPLILVLLGPKWVDCVPFIQILCFSYVLYPLHALNINMMTLQGRSDLLLILQIIKNVITLIPIAIGIWIGIYWMLLASVVLGIVEYFLNSYYAGKRLNYSSRDQIKDVFPAMSICLIIAGLVFSLTLLPLTPFIVLPIQLIIGTVLLIVIMNHYQLPEYLELKAIIIDNIRKHKKK